MQTDWMESGPTGGSLMTPVVKRLMIINAAIWLAVFLLYVFLPAGAFLGFERVLFEWFGVAPHAWNWWLPRVWQVVTYGFLHDYGSPMHLLFNMLGLYFFGSMLEGIVGARRFLGFYLAAIVVGGLVALTWSALSAAPSVTLGASGGVLGVIVAMARLRPKTRVIFFIFPMTLATLAMIFVGLDLFRLLTAGKSMGGDVSFQAHLGGAAFGFLAAHRNWLWVDPFERIESLRSERKQQRAVADEEKLDAILAKIHKNGIHSLSASEKAFLKRAGQRKSG
ncbi:MAG: rhomboid family intramembrane serine protease [Planctomycetota bacterium]